MSFLRDPNIFGPPDYTDELIQLDLDRKRAARHSRVGGFFTAVSESTNPLATPAEPVGPSDQQLHTQARDLARTYRIPTRQHPLGGMAPQGVTSKIPQPATAPREAIPEPTATIPDEYLKAHLAERDINWDELTERQRYIFRAYLDDAIKGTGVDLGDLKSAEQLNPNTLGNIAEAGITGGISGYLGAPYEPNVAYDQEEPGTAFKLASGVGGAVGFLGRLATQRAIAPWHAGRNPMMISRMADEAAHFGLYGGTGAALAGEDASGIAQETGRGIGVGGTFGAVAHGLGALKQAPKLGAAMERHPNITQDVEMGALGLGLTAMEPDATMEDALINMLTLPAGARLLGLFVPQFAYGRNEPMRKAEVRYENARGQQKTVKVDQRLLAKLPGEARPMEQASVEPPEGFEVVREEGPAYEREPWQMGKEERAQITSDLLPEVVDQISRDTDVNPKVMALVSELNKAGVKTTLSGTAYGENVVYADLDPATAAIAARAELPEGWQVVRGDVTATMAIAGQVEEESYTGPRAERVRLARHNTGAGVTWAEARQVVQAITEAGSVARETQPAYDRGREETGVSGMHLKSRQVIEQKMPDQMKAGALLNLLKKNGVKADELGYVEALRQLSDVDPQRIVRKIGLLKALSKTGAGLEEVTFGKSTGAQEAYNDLVEEIAVLKDKERVLLEKLVAHGRETGVGHYDNFPKDDVVGQRLVAENIETTLAIYNKRLEMSKLQFAATHHAGKGMVMPGSTEQLETLITRPGSGGFKSGHWDESDVMTWARQNENEDFDGGKVWHIDEIQSDLHARGRREGYLSKADESKLLALKEDTGRAKRARAVALEAAIMASREPMRTDLSRSARRQVVGERLYQLANDARAMGDFDRAEKMDRARVALISAEIRLAELREKVDWQNSAKIPDAPFKKTWHELGFKRSLAEAVRRGHKRLTWTSAAVQADRWSSAMRGVVSSIEARLNDEGYVYVGAAKRDGGTIRLEFDMKWNERTSGKFIDAYFGKSMSAKIRTDINESGRSYIEGDDIVVGAAGFISLYDEKLPSLARKLGKKYGAKVGKTWLGKDEDGSFEKNKFPVWYMDIPEAMARDIANEGQAVFERPQNYVADVETAIEKIRSGEHIVLDPETAAKVSEQLSLFPEEQALADRAEKEARAELDRLRAAAPEGVDYLYTHIIDGLSKPNGVDVKGWKMDLNDPSGFFAIAQALRNPKFETFRVLYVKQDGNTVTVLDQDAYSNGLARTVRLPWTPKRVKGIQDKLKALGATAVIPIHNHPSRRAVPSGADLGHTFKAAEMGLPILGMAITDHGTYCWSGRDGFVDVWSKAQATDSVSTNDIDGWQGVIPEIASKPDPLLRDERPLRTFNAEAIAQLATQYFAPDAVTALYYSNGYIGGIVNFQREWLAKESNWAKLPKINAQFGGHLVLVDGPGGQSLQDVGTQLIQRDFAMDYIKADDHGWHVSLRGSGVSAGADWAEGKPWRKIRAVQVAEETPEYKKRKKTAPRSERVKYAEQAWRDTKKEMGYRTAIDPTKPSNYDKAIERLVTGGRFDLTTRAERLGIGVDRFRQWYREAVPRYLAVLENELPGALTDPEVSGMLHAVFALTSPGIRLEMNFNQSIDVMKYFQRHGSMPIWVGKPTTDPNKTPVKSLWQVDGDRILHAGGTNFPKTTAAIERLENIIEGEGGVIEGVDWLMQIQPFESFLRYWGKKPREITKTGQHYGGEAFGPKVAPYVQNLQGSHQLAVIDRWATYWAFRHMGNPAVTRAIQKMNREPGSYTHQLVQKDAPGTKTVTGIIQTAMQQLADWQASRTGEQWGPDEIQAVLWFVEKAEAENAGVEKPAVNEYDIAALKRAERKGYGDQAKQVFAAAGPQRGPRRFVTQDAAGPAPAQSAAERALRPARGSRAVGDEGPFYVPSRGRGGRRRDGLALQLGEIARPVSKLTGKPAVRPAKIKQVWEPSALMQSRMRGLPGYDMPTEIVELDDAPVFHSLILQAKASGKYGAAVHAYELDEYKDKRLFVTPDGATGVAMTKDGDMVSLFKNTEYVEGRGKNIFLPMLLMQIQHGGNRCDCFHTVLPNMYSQLGMGGVARVKWNDAFAPEGWDKETFKKFNNGEPDVVLMVYKGGDVNTLLDRYGTFPKYGTYKNQVPLFDEWADAEAVQKRELGGDDTGLLREDAPEYEGAKPPQTKHGKKVAEEFGDEIAEAFEDLTTRKDEITKAGRERARDRVARWYQKWFDRGYPLRRHHEANLPEGTGWEDVTEHPSEVPYQLMRMAAGAPGLAHAFLKKGVTPYDNQLADPKTRGVYEVYNEIPGNEFAAFNIYMQEKRIIDLEEGRMREAERQGRDALLTVHPGRMAKARARVAAAEKTRPEWAKFGREISQYMDSLLEWAEEGGSLDSELLDLLRRMYKNYVPLYEMKLLDAAGNPVVKPGVRAGSIVGHKGNVPEDFVGVPAAEAIVRNTNFIVQTVLANEVKSVAATQGEALGWGDHIRPKVTGQKVGIGEVVEKALTRTQLEEVMDTGALTDTDMEAIATIWRISQYQEDGVIAYREGGKTRYFQFKPEYRDIWDIFAGMNKQSAIHWLSYLSAGSKIFRAFTTGTPDFMLRNISRDIPGSAVLGKSDPSVMNYGRAWVAVWDEILGRDNKLADLYMRSQGAHASLVAPDMAEIQKNLAGLFARKHGKRVYLYAEDFYEASQYLASVSDMWPRIAHFDARLAEEMKKVQRGEKSIRDAVLSAGFDARWPSIDFYRAGDYGQQLNKYIPFFNARLQGLDIFRQRATGEKMGGTRDWKNTWFKGATKLALPTMLLWALNHDEDWYKEQPVWLKLYCWMIPSNLWGEGEPKAIYVIPKPHEVGLVFASLLEQTLNWQLDKDPQAMRQWGREFARSLNPIDIPPQVKALIQWQAEYNFFRQKRSISPYMSSVKPSYQYYEHNTEIGKWLAQQDPTGTLSPIKIDEFVKTSFSTVGMYGMWLASKGVELFAPERRRIRPSKHMLWGLIPLDGVPLIKSFVKPRRQARTEYHERFDMYFAQAQEAYNGLANLTRQGAPDDVKGKAIDNDPEWIWYYKALAKTNQGAYEHAKWVFLIDGMQDPPPGVTRDNLAQWKREKLDEEYENSTRMMKQAVLEIESRILGATEQEKQKYAKALRGFAGLKEQ